MMHTFVLSKAMPDLAAAEALALTNAKEFKLFGNVLIINLKNEKIIGKLAERLAYTNYVCSLLFESSYKDFIENMENFGWDKVYKGSFCVRVHKITQIKNSSIKKINKNYNIKNPEIDKLYPEKELASFVWRKVKNPKVDLENPKTRIDIFFAEKRIYCCLLLKKVDEYYESRRSHLRPMPSPISLHPRLAKAMVNLTGAGEGEIILDPFCGSGGILIEAGLMGLRTEGFDISRKMIWKSMVNLRHYGIKDCKLGAKDFFKIKKKYRYIVADFPYGLNTAIMGNVRVTKSNRKQIKQYLDKFYSGIIKKLEKILLKKAVVIFPSYFNYNKFIKKSKLKLINEFDSYVHGNLTRKIVVLEK
ncbi:MAG: DNA methyltransferase [Nanoarchaeota archaeon]